MVPLSSFLRGMQVASSGGYPRAEAAARRYRLWPASGAGDENRTRVTSLGSWCSAIELRRQVGRPGETGGDHPGLPLQGGGV